MLKKRYYYDHEVDWYAVFLEGKTNLFEQVEFEDHDIRLDHDLESIAFMLSDDLDIQGLSYAKNVRI